MAKLSTLKKRKDFTQVKLKGCRVVMPHFLVQAFVKEEGDMRWGFIITKKIGNAVVRHKIRRRLKEIIRALPQEYLTDYTDYVIVPKKVIAVEPFSVLKQQVEHALYKMAKTLRKHSALKDTLQVIANVESAPTIDKGTE